jgi:hypothetical protein
LEARSEPFDFLGSCRVYGTYHFKYEAQAGSTFNHALQLGLQWFQDSEQGRSMRLAVDYYEGHSEFGEFYKQYDQHMGIGVFFDP